MKRSFLFLAGVLFAFSVSAVTNSELVENLSSRIHNLSNDRGSLIKSFTHHNQSYIYDQALAIIAFTKENDQENARKLLNGLRSLQMQDGSLYFSYFLDGTSPYPAEGDKRIAGAMSWVALAAVHYQNKFKSKEFFIFNDKLLSYLQSQIHPIEIENKKVVALRFEPKRDVAALEHNLDAYAAFLHFAKVNNTEKWNHEIAGIKSFILSMWDKRNSHFWSGASFERGSINKSELYLDNQTWTLLALDQNTLREISPDDALKVNCEKFLVNHEGVTGFMDSKPARGPASYQFVWSEGTLGQVLAMKKLRKIKNQTVYCKEFTSSDFLNSVKKMKKEDGGIAYATNTSNKDFTNSSSVAGTAWLYFATNDINPFELN